MTRIRVAIGELQTVFLRDSLAHITDLQPDMELVGQLPPHNLKLGIAEQKPDVLICEIRPDELPKVCRELFSDPKNPPPVIVGLTPEGRVAICIADASPTQLIGTIRTAVLDAATGGKVLDFVRPTDGERLLSAPEPYASNAECLNDQLRCLDLALLAELDTFESTVWDDSTQRLQGLAISPDEVRALLQPRGFSAGQRQGADLRRRRVQLQEWITKRIAVTVGQPSALPFVRLIERFDLGPFEQACITAALALEIDRNKYGKAYALLQDDVTRKQPSLELLLRLFGHVDEAERWGAVHAFDSMRPLRRWNLLRVGSREAGEPATPFGRGIDLDDRISRFLLGFEDLGAQLEGFATTGPWDPDVLRVPADTMAQSRLVRLVLQVRDHSPGAPPRLVVHLRGRRGTGRRSLVVRICEECGLRLLRADAGRLAALPASAVEDALLALARESALQPTALCLENVDSLLDDDPATGHGLRAIMHALRMFGPVTFILSQRPWVPENLFGDGVFQSVVLNRPDAARARNLWIDALGGTPLAEEVDGPAHAATELAARFNLSPGQILDAVAAARTRALWEKPDDPRLTQTDLYRACRDQCSNRLEALARQVTTGFGWDDLKLPENQLGQLRDLEKAIRNSTGVLQDWDFQSRLPYGRGITALFSGPSGTGKTMAAGILARELGLDLYRIDLAHVVSKYIGETEKNLDRIFAQAEDANAMLFFDEADALFGKRSAIKDAHDRYANIEVAYLLQKMEERVGATILATNLKTNLDEAFLRRIRFAVEFPMPEYAQRLEIWRSSLPTGIRLSDDVDLPKLAKRLRVSGGSIMNVCVGAASLAYRPGGAIAMEHFSRAAKRELQKLGYQYHESDFAADEASATPRGAEMAQ
jgi:hypothetical protein